MPDIIQCPTCKRETYRGMVDCPHCGSKMPSHLLTDAKPLEDENGWKSPGFSKWVARAFAIIAIGLFLKMMFLAVFS